MIEPLTDMDIAFAKLEGNNVARELHQIKTMIDTGVKFYERAMPRQVGKTRKLAEISERLTEEGITNCVVVPTHSMVISTRHIYKNGRVKEIGYIKRNPLNVDVVLVDEIYHCLYDMNVDTIREFRQACGDAVIYGLGTVLGPSGEGTLSKHFKLRE